MKASWSTKDEVEFVYTTIMPQGPSIMTEVKENVYQRKFHFFNDLPLGHEYTMTFTAYSHGVPSDTVEAKESLYPCDPGVFWNSLEGNTIRFYQ